MCGIELLTMGLSTSIAVNISYGHQKQSAFRNALGMTGQRVTQEGFTLNISICGELHSKQERVIKQEGLP